MRAQHQVFYTENPAPQISSRVPRKSPTPAHIHTNTGHLWRRRKKACSIRNEYTTPTRVLFLSLRTDQGKQAHPVLKYRVPHGSHQARGILPVAEEQSRTRSQSGDVEDQPQCRGLWHHSSPSARSLSCSPSLPPPSFTQSPSPPRSLVRDGQTSPHHQEKT